MKKWLKSFIPESPIDVEKLNSMSIAEQRIFFQEFVRGEVAKVWISFTEQMIWLSVTGRWQYIVAIWLR
jgi:hypothetical protein